MFDLSYYAFNPHAIPIFTIGAFTLCLGLLAYWSNKAAAPNRHFLILCLSISVWLCATGAGLLSRNPELAYRWFKLDNFGVMYISVAFYSFSVEFLGLRRPRSIRLGYMVATLLALTVLFTDRFVTGVQEHWWGYYPKWGVYSIPFFFLFFGYMAAAFSAFFLSYRRALSPIQRNQVYYVQIACLIGYIGSVDFFPVFGYSVYPFGYIPIFLLVSVITFTIFRYRLLDISIVINKGLAYSLLLGAIFVPVYLAVFVSQRATFYSLPPLLAGTLTFACGLWVVLRNVRAVTHTTFGLVCLGISFWLFGTFMLYSTTDEKEALFWQKFVYVGVVFIPAFFYHFCVSFRQRQVGGKLILATYLVSTLFLLLIPTHYLLNGHYSYFWGYYPKAGVLHPLFLGYFALVTGVSLQTLYVGSKVKEAMGPLDATRMNYIFWAFVIGFAASSDFVQSYGFQFYPLGYLFVTLWAMIVAYAIAKYQLMDISLILTQTKIRPYARVLTLIPLYVGILLLIWAFTGSLQYILSGILVVAFTILAGLFDNLRALMEKAVEKALFRKKYDAYETLTAFSKSLVTILDLGSLTEEIVHTLVNVIDIKTASLYLFDKEKDFYALSYSHGLNTDEVKTIKLRAGDDLPHHLANYRSILVREELEHVASPEAVQTIVHTLAAMGTEVCIPLINKDRLIGFCNLGLRSNEQMYSEDDLSLLTALGQNAAIALDNAMLYRDLKRSQTLMQRTDRLRSLETIAGGFAHEIRNPLTSIKTFVQLAPERKDDSEFIDQFSKVVSEDIDRIERLIQEILDYARYMEPRFVQEDLNDVVASCLYFIEVKADSKSVRVEKALGKDLPRVLLDRQQIKQVLLNLFLNAMDAMASSGGRLTVKTRRLIKQTRDAWVQIEVADTGSGITADNLKHIFDPFYSTKHESGEREGTGLGLSIIHQIVQEHRGYIEVDSAVGSGTTFFVNLPVNPVLADPSKEQQSHESTNPISR